MYYAIVIAFMFVLPIASMMVEPLVTNTPFEFWAKSTSGAIR